MPIMILHNPFLSSCWCPAHYVRRVSTSGAE